jgi:hypothetical protein
VQRLAGEVIVLPCLLTIEYCLLLLAVLRRIVCLKLQEHLEQQVTVACAKAAQPLTSHLQRMAIAYVLTAYAELLSALTIGSA